MNKTYRIIENGTAILCLKCNMVSRNLNDVENRYCGRCKFFHGDFYSIGFDKNYAVAAVNDLFILLIDIDNGRTITNSAARVIEDLNGSLPGGIGRHRVFYRDTMGRFDQLETDNGRFIGFAPGTPEQQDKFKSMLRPGPF